MSGAREIFWVFLGLGVSSFGGPIAHLGYFRTAFVERRRWLSEEGYADLVALCQFLPGPASSQVGFAVGLLRGGWLGGLAAWCGFTLPSAAALVLFAYGAGTLGDPFSLGVIAGLKILAVAVVADAVLGMGRTLCPDRPRLAIALAGLVILSLWGGAGGQIFVILAGAVAGLLFVPRDPTSEPGKVGFGVPPVPSRPLGLALTGVAVALLVLVPVLVHLGVGGQALALFEAFYRAGALVFGGGHVVLPLLEESVVAPGWMEQGTFLAGYGAAQAVPGPLFTLAAYLGAVAAPAPNGLTGAAIALAAIFLPGLLLVAGALPWWDRFRGLTAARSLLAGVNAAVVGILGAALYDPVFTAGILDPFGFAIAAIAFFALRVWRTRVWIVVVGVALTGGLRGVAGL